MRTRSQPKPNTSHAVFTEDSTYFDIYPVLWVISQSPTFSIQCTSASLTTSRIEFSTSWRRTNTLTSTMQPGYLCLLTTTSQQKIGHMRKFLNGKG
jgi:hypothetical protein